MLQLFRANADLYETEDEVVAKFDLPGVDQDDIDIQIVDNDLQVQVERMSETEDRRENAFLLERSFSGYFRSIPIPDEADIENVSADYSDGVLTVRFPIREGAQRTISSSGRGGAESAEPSGSGGISVRRVASPYQERLSREEMLRQGSDSPLYRSGTGSFYSNTFVKPTGEASPESEFSAGSVRMESLTRREAAVAQREAEVSRREAAVSRPGGTGSLTTGRASPESGGPFQQRLSREEMMRQGTDSPIYRSGSGSYYSNTFERPTGDAAPEAYFGQGSAGARAVSIAEREASVAQREAVVARREMTASGSSAYQKGVSRDEMLRQGSDSPLYRSGSGSYYPGTFEKPSGVASPESSFGRKEDMTAAGEFRKRGSREKRSNIR